MSSEMVFKEARALPLAEQIELCRNLWDGILESKELTPGEAELIDRRLQDHLENPDDVVSWEEVKAKLDAQYCRGNATSSFVAFRKRSLTIPLPITKASAKAWGGNFARALSNSFNVWLAIPNVVP